MEEQGIKFPDADVPDIFIGSMGDKASTFVQGLAFKPVSYTHLFIPFEKVLSFLFTSSGKYDEISINFSIENDG